MSNPTVPLLAELPEDRASGEIAGIYEEIRRFSGVPYVSSLQRYLATMPGVLEWAWAALRPALVSGVIPETGWALARTVRIAPLPPLSPAIIAGWGLNAADIAALRNIAANFVRVSPVNIVTGSCLACLLTGPTPSGAGFHENWTPPAMLAPMPGNIDPDALPTVQRDQLMRFATEVDGAPFIPALYRQLAHWPEVIAWFADALIPRFTTEETNTARAGFKAAARAAAPGIVAQLPGVPQGQRPDAETTRHILVTVDRYAETSPEMTMFGQLLLDALPPA